MLNVTPTEPKRWVGSAFLCVGLITALRIALLAFDQTDLFVDEAQYWLWGQDLAFGYYSKPPLIGWVIRLFTEIAGSDAAFWVRLPAPLFHGATAMILGALAYEIWDARTAWTVAVVYITLPFVTVGSFLISTDTIMFPFLSLSLLFWLRALRERTFFSAVLAGAFLGIAALSKYAAVYYILCAVLAGVFVPYARPKPAQILAALLAFVVVLSPNLMWNLQNGLSTLEHTMDNADWVRDPAARASLNVDGLIAFFGAQFIVFGPITLAVLLWMGWVWKADHRALLLFALPILLFVCVQALLSKAYANWAVATYLAGTLLITVTLLRVRWLLGISLALHGTFALFVPVATTQAKSLTLDGQTLLLSRYLGRAEMTETLVEIARNQQASAIIARNRDILADLKYRAPDNLAVFAFPPTSRAKNHYELAFAVPRSFEGNAIFVTRAHVAVPCDATPVQTIAPERGAYRGEEFVVFFGRAAC